MLTRALDIVRRRLGAGEGGFTLVELLIVIAAGTVLLLALFAMLDMTLRQTSRTFTMTDATGRAQFVTETLENEVHSACVSYGITPIQSSSDSTHLWLISQYGSTATNANVVTPIPVEHEITFNSATGQLTDAVFPETGYSNNSWTFSSTASSTTVLATNAAQLGSTPVFQYFAYQNPGSGYTDADGNQYEMLIDGINEIPGTTIKPAASPLSVPLTSTTAATAAEVLLSLKVGAVGGSDENTTNLNSQTMASVTDQMVLRDSPPANHIGTGTTFTPCA